MNVINLLKDAKVVRVSNSAVAATSAIDTAVVDTQGYDSVAFIALLGDVTATSVLTLTAKTNTASSTSSPTPVTLAEATTTPFTAGASDADSKLLIVDVNNPRARYVFATLTRTTANAVVDGVIAVLYNKQDRPLTAQDATVLASVFANDPV